MTCMRPCPAAATQRLHCSPPQSLARVVAWARVINLSSIIQPSTRLEINFGSSCGSRFESGTRRASLFAFPLSSKVRFPTRAGLRELGPWQRSQRVGFGHWILKYTKYTSSHGTSMVWRWARQDTFGAAGHVSTNKTTKDNAREQRAVRLAPSAPRMLPRI